MTDNSGVIDSVEALLKVLRPLTPQSYSISSSLNCHLDEVHLTVATVRYNTEGKQHSGVGSGYLADLVNPGDAVSVYFAPNNSFSLPADDSAPIIFIGPGTGIALSENFYKSVNTVRPQENPGSFSVIGMLKPIFFTMTN